MRIALFTETFVPKVDGIVTTICQTIRQLVSLGHQVLIFSPDGGIREYEGCRIVGIPGHAFPFYPELRLSFPHASIRGQLVEFQPDLIHVVEPALLGIAGLYYAGGKHGGALCLPLVISYHTDLPKYMHYYKMSFMEPFVWQILRARHNRATINLCTSVTVVDEMRAHGIERVALWPGGVDTERFRPECRSDEMRARLTGGHPESPLLLYVGRLSAEKGIETLRPILQANPGARLALVGDGPHHQELERHFAGLPVVMPGFLHGEELAAAYASCDVFVMPSRTETLGLVVLEAMAAARPVVGARAGGIPEMIDSGVSGFLFEEVSEAIAAVRELLSSKQKRDSIGVVAREQATHHGWKAATLQLLDQYRAAIQSQVIVPLAERNIGRSGLRYRTRKAFNAATMFTIRKLLP